MAKPLAIDNSKLREEARQQRREQARLQLPTEKQPTKNLFGPPIPVSRPNDPTFEQLSNFFGSPVGADISCFRSLSNNDCSPTDRSSQGHRPSVMRHTDARDTAEQSNSRRTEHRQNESRLSGDARPGETRHSDTRHSDIKHRDSRPGDVRNTGSGEPAVRSSRPCRGVAVVSLPDVEPSRQGVFEQFVKSASSKTPSTVESDGVAAKTSAARQSAATHGKTKHRTSSFSDSKSEELLSSGCRLAGSKPESQSKLQQPAASQSKCSSDVSPSSFPSGKMNGVRKEMNGSPPDRRTASGKGNDKLSGGRVNGIHQGVDMNGKNSEVGKKLKLHISKEYEKCDDLVTKVLQAVTIRSPLTGILTPKKTDFPFAFPDTTHQFNETIPEGFLSSDEEDGREVVMVDHGPVQRPEVKRPEVQRPEVQRPEFQRPERLCDYAGKTIPNQSSSVLHDLNISDSSDSETEQVEENSAAQRTLGGAGQISATDPKLSWAVPSTGNAKGRHLSESSEASSTEGSCTSGSESDTSQSDNEDGAVKKTGGTVKDEDDEAEAKQFKRTSWEIKNFIPKSNEQVPFILSSPPSPLFAGVNRQTSNAGFDIDINDPIKEMYMMSPQQVMSPMLTSAESCHSVDVVCPSSPKIPPSPRIAVNGPRPVASPAGLSSADLLPSSVLELKGCAYSPERRTSFLAPISGVEYRAGNPSVVVRIRRSYLLKKAKNAKHRDSASSGTCRTADTTQVSASAVSSRGATPSSQAQIGCAPDISGYSPESAMKSDRSSALDTSTPRNPSCHSSHTRVPESTPERTSIALAPSSFELTSADRKESRIESSPAKCSQDETAPDVTNPISSKATKRKSDDVGRLDSKKICDRRKEDRKSQSSQLQNGKPDNSQKQFLAAPDFKIEPKSPTMNGEDNNSRSSSSSSSSHVQKRTERTKSQNGHSRPDDKTRKISSSKVNGKVSDSEAPNSVTNRSAKGTTPVVNGIGKSPSDPNPDICGENGLSISGDIDDIGKRIRVGDGDCLTVVSQKNSLNGIKRFKYEPEKLESSDYYMRNARKLKHEGDSRPDKFFKVLNYTDSVLAFLCHCSALEAEHAEFARVQKMYQDTLALCQYVVRVMESVVCSEKYHLIAINLRIQAIISLRLYSIRKADVAKLKSVLDEHNKSYMSKPLQIPSPYQTNHHHSTNNTAAAAAAAVSWGHANGTPSPRSPRPSPSPAGSIGSVGSAGSSNGDNTGMAKPLSVVNGHSLTSSIVVPQRIHSVMMNFVNYMNYLHQCLDCWDQAEAILVTHPAVGVFFHSVDSEFGPIDLHSPALAIVRYASEVVAHVRNEVKRTSQVVRTD